MTAFSTYCQLQGGQVIYSKYLIPIALKALDYFRSAAHVSDENHTAQLMLLEENVFCLLVCFVNNYAKRYYSPPSSIHSQKPASLIPDGILADMHVFGYLFELKSERLAKFLR